MTVQAKLVIAADGLHSALGRRLGVVQPIRWLQHVALVAYYAQVDMLQPWGEMFLIPFGYIGLAPVTADLVNVSLVIHAQRLSRVRIKPEVFLEQTIHTHPEIGQRFTHAVRMKKLLTIQSDGAAYRLSQV